MGAHIFSAMATFYCSSPAVAAVRPLGSGFYRYVRTYICEGSTANGSAMLHCHIDKPPSFLGCRCIFVLGPRAFSSAFV